MNAYFDTAIILKLYVQEANSPEAVRLVDEVPDAIPPDAVAGASKREPRYVSKPFGRKSRWQKWRLHWGLFDADILAGRWKKPEYKEATVRLAIGP